MLYPTDTAPRTLFLLLLCATALATVGHAQSWSSDDGSVTELPAGDGKTMLMRDPASARRATLDQMDAVEWSKWRDLPALLNDIHTRTGIPAIAAAFVRNGEIVAQATVGLRAADLEDPVQPTDAFHLGSVTKSFTATLIGKLVEEGLLEWDFKMGDVLADADMHAGYRHVTLEQLLQHRGGLPPFTDAPLPGLTDFDSYTGPLAERRAKFLAETLTFEPVGVPGETMLYSNLGYALAGLMAERVTGESWETLVAKVIFEPLEMHTAGIGVPTMPMGHAGDASPFMPVPMASYPRTERIAPAGNIHCSVSDLARYAQSHLAGLAGKDDLLRSETVRRLHTVPSAAGAMRYAGGWFMREGALGQPVHWHGGTIGASYAEIKLYPATNSALIVLTTVNSGLGEALASQVGRALLERYGATPSGFVMRGADNGGIQVVKQELSPGDDARFWRIISGLANSINDEDRKGYRALFAPSYNARSRDSIFDFMANGVLPRRGGIHTFHDAPAPFTVDDSDHVTRMVVFHLENGFPGYLGIVLDDDEKIVELSLFVKADLCRNGSDRRCDLITKSLAEVSR